MHTVRVGICVMAALFLLASSGLPGAVAADYYASNKPGTGAGTQDDPFGLADLTGDKEYSWLGKAQNVLQPGDTLWFKGGEYALKTRTTGTMWSLPFLRPARSGEPGKPISFCAMPNEKVVLKRVEGNQPVAGCTETANHVRFEGLILDGPGLPFVVYISGDKTEIAYCEIIGTFADTTDNHDGIWVTHADGSWIHHNIIHGVQGPFHNSTGIKVYVTQDLVVEDNYIYDNTVGIFDKDSGINNTYRRNFITGNKTYQFHGNNQGKDMQVKIHDNVIDGGVDLGYLTDKTEVFDNLIRGERLAGHWAGDLWNSKLWNNIVIAKGKHIDAYSESKNLFVAEGEKKHLEYMDHNIYTATPQYSFGEYSRKSKQVFSLEEMRAKGFEKNSRVVEGPAQIFVDETAYKLLPEWAKAGRHGDAPGPEDIAAILDTKRYGPEARGRKEAQGKPPRADPGAAVPPAKPVATDAAAPSAVAPTKEPRPR